MEEISVGITIFTAMITPAVLILACGSLLLTTSQRLNRSIDRTRKIFIEFKEIKQENKSMPGTTNVVPASGKGCKEIYFIAARNGIALYLTIFLYRYQSSYRHI